MSRPTGHGVAGRASGEAAVIAQIVRDQVRREMAGLHPALAQQITRTVTTSVGGGASPVTIWGDEYINVDDEGFDRYATFLGSLIRDGGVDAGQAPILDFEGFGSVSVASGVATIASAVAAASYLDWSDDSDPQGWSSFDQKLVYYLKLGALVFLQFAIDGTSDNATTYFTAPFGSLNLSLGSTFATNIYDSGTAQTIPGSVRIGQNTDQVDLYLDSAGNSFTGSGRKVTTGAIFYLTDE